MTLLVPWIAFPAIMAALALGCGMFLARLIRGRIPGALLLPAGVAVMVVLGSVTTISSATARVTTPLVVAVAAAGFALRGGAPRVSRWAGAAAAVVFVCYGAPVLLSGSATFAGYVEL